MPPKAKARKPKKPALKPSATALQKQKQSQRVVVNINQQEKARRRRASKPRQRQTQLPTQVSVQPIISMSGSVPIPQPFFNPSPIQSSGGFNPTPSAPSLGTPISISEPVVLPTFAEESVRVIGDENVSIPIVQPVSAPESIIVPIKPVIPDDRPIVMPRPVPPPPTSIISTKPPLTTDKSEASSGRFLLPTPPARSEMKPADDKSIASMLNELSKETGITSQSVADFIFKKKKPKAPPSVSSSISNSQFISQPSSDVSVPESISSIGGFNLPSEKSSIKKKPIIDEQKEVVVLKKPEVKMNDPYSIFSDSGSIARDVPVASDIASDVATKGTSKSKPPKKRLIIKDTASDLEKDAPAGRRMPPIKEKKSNYQSLGELQKTAVDKGIPIYRVTGKKKTREELRLEILGRIVV